MLLAALWVLSLESCRSRTPYERRIAVLEAAPGVEPIRTPEWRWESCAEQAGIPNAYRITRASYVLILAHSTEPHIAPAFYLAASSPNRTPLDIEGVIVRPIFAKVGEPTLALRNLGVQATHYAWISKPSTDHRGVIVLNIGDRGSVGHEELRYRDEFLKCAEYEGS